MYCKGEDHYLDKYYTTSKLSYRNHMFASDIYYSAGVFL